MSTPDRHLTVFGCNPELSSTYDRTIVRWGSQESLYDWSTAITNTAGSQKLGTGTNIESAAKGRGQMILWTDVDLYSMQFVGPPFTFTFQQLGEASGTISKNSPAMIEGGAFWMGINNFYAYDGSVKTLKCPVLNRVFDSFNQVQREKVFSAEIIEFNEIWWFYPSSELQPKLTSMSYIIMLITYGQWVHWTERRGTTRAYSLFPWDQILHGTVFNQEKGVNDVTSAMTASMSKQVFSVEMQNGDNIIFMNKIIPDTSFGEGTTIKFQLKSKRYPNDSEITKGPYSITSSTNKLNFRTRGRSFQCKWYTDETDVTWRLGTWRAQGQADGTR